MNLSENLKTIFGDVNFSESVIDKIIYSNDASQNSSKTSYVVWPTNIEQLHKLISLCKRTNISLNVRGSGSSKSGGSLSNNSIIVDMSKMRNIIELKHDSVLVEAGLPLSVLNQLTNNKFPFIPYNHLSSTIGGMLATNALSLKAMEHNRIMDWVKEVEILTGNGMLVKLKDEAVSHVIGMEGLTGIIIKVRLKLSELVESSIDMMQFNTITALVNELQMLKQNPEVINIEYLSNQCSSLMGLEDKHILMVEYNNDSGELKDIKKLWGQRLKLPKLLKQQNYKLVEDVTIKDYAKFLYWLWKNNVPCYGPIGVNTFFPTFKENLMLEQMKSFIKNLNGNLGSVFGYGYAKKEYINKEKRLRIMSLKAYYDPKNIMGRGKLI